MSDKRKMRQRRQSYRRLHGEKKAVSPVVATLILILIAVAAAAALYLWLVVWQGNLTKGIGQPGAQSTLSIGGSTSVYPFSSLGVTWFEQNNSDVVISDNQGGTGAGMIALCQGNIDLGASSTPQTVSTMETSYGCSSSVASTLTFTTVAYDAVDVIVSSSNTHGLLSMSADTLNTIYEYASTSAPFAYIGTIDGVTLPITGLTLTAGTAIPWADLPAAVNGATVGTLGIEEAESAGAGVGGAACAVPYSNDICAATFGTTVTPCGFSICMSGAGAATPIERSDASGTTQTFEAKILGYGTGASSNSKGWATTQTGTGFANLGYAGCGGNNLLTDCGFVYPTTQQGSGNPGVIGLVSGNANAIGYASDGDARASGSNVVIVPFLGLGQNIAGAGVGGGASSLTYGAVTPTTGTTGTIAAGLTNSASVSQYVGGRPFQLISLEPLSGVAQEFMTFITDPATNAALAAATHEVGLYSVVA